MSEGGGEKVPGGNDRRRRQRVDVLFAQALEVEDGERQAFLGEVCGGDLELRREVEDLLEAAEVEDDFLPPGGAASPELLAALKTPAEPLPTPSGRPTELESGVEGAGPSGSADDRIGRYRLVKEIGRGGMGVVFLAERADGQFEQQVALKLLPFGARPAAVDRFSRERQILANLEHPKIARLIDGGLTDSGQPYLVMEYVAGLAVDRACRQGRFPLERRLRLLTEICEAVEAAHRQLVIHRDLKPSNILVGEDGGVRLLDFGIAKLLDEREAAGILEAPEPTATAERLLTPQYASPEQVAGERVTVASDVYQLGLLAYELLTGQRPYELAGLTAAEAYAKVCEEVPQKPSSVGAGSGGKPFPGRLTGDLDLIVLKALHKDPERRYRSVEALRLDLERYLEGLPVSARPDVWTYRLSKFVSRHRWAVTAALITVTVLALLVTAFVWRLARERDQTRFAAQRAEERRAEAEEVTAFLVGLFEASTPFAANLVPTSPGKLGAESTARELLEQGRRRLEEAFPDRPLVRARLLQVVGRIYRNLEIFDEAEPLLTEALELRLGASESLPGGPRELDVAESFADLGSLLAQTGREHQAEPYYRESLARMVTELGEDHPEAARAQGNLGNLLHRLEQYQESEELLRSALTTLEAQEEPDELRIAWLLSLLGRALRERGEVAEAHPLLERSTEIYRRRLEPDDHWLARSLVHLAMSHYHQGRPEDAIPLYREALRIDERNLGPESQRVALDLDNLAHSLFAVGRGDESGELMERALAIHAAAQGEESSSAMRVRYNLAYLRLRQGDAGGAERELRRLQAILEEASTGPTLQSAMTWASLGEALVAQGRPGADAYFRRSEEEILALFGPKAKQLASPVLSRGRLARERGDLAAAEALLRQGLEILEVNLSPEAEQLADVRQELADLYRQRGKMGEAEALLGTVQGSNPQ